MSDQLPLIPFLTNWADVTFLFFILARIGGLFIISPFLSSHFVPRKVKLGLTLFLTAMMAMMLYPLYRGIEAKFFLPELEEGSQTGIFSLTLLVARELAIGYLIGFAFSLLFEALLLAGQTIGVLVSFSAMEMLDPVSNTPQSMIGQLLMVTGTLLLLSLDLHHEFLNLLAYSFKGIPLGNYNFPLEMQQDLLHGTSRMLTYSVKFAAIPYAVLFLVTVTLGLMAKVMPEMNIFIVGLPLKILIGYYTLILLVHFLPLTFQQGFHEFYYLAQNIIRYIGF